MNRQRHWQSVYRTKVPTEVSWFATHLDLSLRLIREVADLTAEIIDVGGGASSLVDDLLDEGYRALTVLDVSQAALDVASERLAVG